MTLRGALLASLVIAFACSPEHEPPTAASSVAPTLSSSASATSITSTSASASPSADVVSGASTQSSYAPVIAEGKLDGAALRARNLKRLQEDESPVIALTGTDAATLGERLCEAVVPRRPTSTPVLIKPNIGGFDSLKDPATHAGDDGIKGRITNPEFVRGVIRCLKARGHTSITIADGWGAPHSMWEKLVARSGYEALARDEKVPLVCMCDDGVFDTQGNKPGAPFAISGMERTNVPSLLLPKILVEHLSTGLFIEIPKLKAHRFAVVSLGIKNLQGVVMSSQGSPAHRQKWRMHAELVDYMKTIVPGSDDRALYVRSLEKFADRMVDVLEIATPDAVLLEGTPAMQGDGFQLMVPVTPMIAIGGTNTIRVDQIGATFLGAFANERLAAGLRGKQTSPLIEQAGKRFNVDFARTRVEGDGASAATSPRPFVYKAIAPFAIGRD